MTKSPFSRGKMTSYNYCIIGNGPLGIGLAYLIQRALHQEKIHLFFLGRSGPAAVKCHLEHKKNPFLVETDAPHPNHLTKVDVCFVCVKAFDLKTALSQHLPFLNPKAVIITLCNGYIEPELEIIIDDFPGFTWRSGLSTFGVTAHENNLFSLHSNQGEVLWGPIPTKKGFKRQITHSESLLLESKPHTFSWKDDIRPFLMKKWLFNAVTNTLSATKNLPCNGQLLKDPGELKKTFFEVLQLSEKVWQEKWQDHTDELYTELLSIINQTSENENSMRRDVRLKRKTENSFLAGLSEKYAGFQTLKKLSHQIESSL